MGCRSACTVQSCQSTSFETRYIQKHSNHWVGLWESRRDLLHLLPRLIILSQSLRRSGDAEKWVYRRGCCVVLPMVCYLVMVHPVVVVLCAQKAFCLWTTENLVAGRYCCARHITLFSFFQLNWLTTYIYLLCFIGTCVFFLNTTQICLF